MLAKISLNRNNFLPGILLNLFGIFIAISLISYNPDDPSLNRAANSEITNLAGAYGAYIADPILQFFGFAIIFPTILIFIYGMNLLYANKINLLPARFAAFFFSLIMFSAIFDLIEPRESLPFLGCGGFVGHLLIKLIPHKYLVAPLIAVCSLIACTLFIVATGIKFETLKYFVNLVSAMSIWGVKLLLYPFVKFFTKTEMKIEAPREISKQVKKRIKPVPKKLPEQNIRTTLEFELPSLDLLNQVPEKSKKNTPSDNTLKQNAQNLEKVLADFGINGKITDVHPGPVVTLYELEPSAGTKSSRIIGLADDIARSMSAVSARIAVIPGRNAIGIELPNLNREIVYLKEMLETDEYVNSDLKLPIVLGKDISGKPIIVDLTKMPHLLVAGTTGSGKSVAINTMILSLLYYLPPDQCKFIMIDPKMLELSVYDNIPHLLTPVVTEPAKAITALKWTVKEMENRYRLMSNLGVRNIAGYNKRIEEAISNNEVLDRTVQTGFNPETGKPIFEKVPFEMKKMSFIVVIVDEMADLMLVAGKEIESSIQRLAQMARAAGIHIIMATQRPSVDIITGVIKANFPTRISFQVTSRIDSRTILGEQGAEQLLGMGDMLYMASGSRITRVHGPFVDDKEVEQIVSYLKTQSEPEYIDEVTEFEDESNDDQMTDSGGADDDLYRQALAIVKQEKKASTSYIQRCLRIGYNRAATIIERMEKEGIVTKANHVGKREVIE